jgi:hypothetical protein
MGLRAPISVLVLFLFACFKATAGVDDSLIHGGVWCTAPWNNFNCPAETYPPGSTLPIVCNANVHQLTAGGGTKVVFAIVPGYGNCNTHADSLNRACPAAPWDDASGGCTTP